VLLLWQQTPPSVGLPLLFRQGSLQQQGAALPPAVVTWSIGEGADSVNFSGTVQAIAIGSLVINERRDALSFTGNLKNSGALSILERKDAIAINGNLRDSASLAITERRDTVLFNGSVTQNSVTGALVINERRDSVAFTGTSQSSDVRGATNYWGRIKERHLRPDSQDYSKAIAEAIRQEQQARLEKQRLEKELKAVKQIPARTIKRAQESVKPWIDPTKELRRRIEVQDTLIAHARNDELALRLQAVQAERVAKQNQEQDEILLILMALER